MLKLVGFSWLVIFTSWFTLWFTRMVSISLPCYPPASASQSAGITGLSHRAWQVVDIFNLFNMCRLLFCCCCCLISYICIVCYFFYSILGFGVHVQNMQDCCIGTSMEMWFAAFLPNTSIWHFSLCYPSPAPHPPLAIPFFPQ